MNLTAEKTNEIIEYCAPHAEQMWAAYILSIIFDCDFRDVSTHLKKYTQETK